MTFVNPYNFVPFGNADASKKKKREDVYAAGKNLLSGWMDIRVVLKTPLIIPDGAHPKPEKIKKNVNGRDTMVVHNHYGFQKLPVGSGDGKMSAMYAIPGSEIRGMIRSAYEAVTDSCVPFLLKDNSISQRVPIYGALRRRGLLKKEQNDWVLYNAKANEIEELMPRRVGQEVKLYKGDHVFGTNEYEIMGCYVKGKGVLQYNIPVNTNDPYHAVYLEAGEVVFPKEGDSVNEANALYKQLKSSLKRDGVEGTLRNRNSNKKPNEDLLKALEAENEGRSHGHGVPVYYFEVQEGKERQVYISNAAIGRIAQRRKWAEIMGEHTPCDGKGALCPACLLFGTKEGNGLRSRIRFADAFPDEPDNIKTEEHTLAILGKPRPSAFEFYLEKPEDRATYWNFDFYGIKKQYTSKEGTANAYTEYHYLNKALPRGRKMYWHHMPFSPSSAQKGNLNDSMEAILPKGTDGKETAFRSRLFFDEITQEQLETLLWVITIGEASNDGSHYWHKLGHAKPLGYGSCKLIVEDVYQRDMSIDKEQGLHATVKRCPVTASPNERLVDSKAKSSFVKICDARSTEGKRIQYPQINNKVFEWFSKNRRNMDTVQILPGITDEVITLEEGGVDRRRRNSPKDNRKTVTLTALQTDNKSATMQVGKYKNGMVFKIPKSDKLKVGDQISVIVNSKKGETEFGDYKGKV